MRRRGKICWEWLLFGFAVPLQLISSLSIAEAFVLLVGPIWLLQDWARLRKDGFMPAIALSFFMIIGCAVGSAVNHTPGPFVLRGMATTCIVFFSIVVLHRLFVRHLDGLSWYFLGLAIASVVCIFVFKQAAEAGVRSEAGFGNATAEEIMNGPIFWISRLGAFVNVPINGWYLQTPIIYSVLTPLGMAIFAALTTASGRSSALVSVAAGAIVLIGGKRRKSMIRISRYFICVIVAGLILVNLGYRLYCHAAENRWLGEDAVKKYELQTAGGRGIMRLLFSGRASAFMGLLAIADKPIVGHGPWAMDYNGYNERFLAEYGSFEDYESYIKGLAAMRKNGYVTGLIGCHSQFVELWVWFGIFGFFFAVYVLFAWMRYVARDAATVPQWFGYLAVQMPSMLWGYFFSPFASRIPFMTFLVCCLMVRAVKKGAVHLPLTMQEQIRRAEHGR